MSDQPARPADAFALPVKQDFATSGWQIENDNWTQKYHLGVPAERPREARLEPAGSIRLMPAAPRSRLRQGHGGK